MSTGEEDWKVDCSDDENYGLTYSEMLQQWVPDPSSTCELFESYTEDSSKECSLFTLDWVCPGRKEIKTTETSGDAGGEEQKTEEKSDFDFWDEPKESNKTAVVPRRIGPGVYSNKQPRGSAKKKTTSLDGIMASMRRHRKLDQQPDKSSSQVPSIDLKTD